MMWGYDGWGMLLGGVWMVLFWGVLIGLVIWAVNRLTAGSSGRREQAETPLDIARRRLAQGEITFQEFEELKRALQ